MNHCEDAQIEALRWALDKLDEQFAKARQARANYPQEIEDDEGEPVSGRGYFDEQQPKEK